MMETLTLWIATGTATLVIQEPTTYADCRDLIGYARFADASGGELHRDEGLVVRLACGGHDIVLALPASDGNCEVPSS